jgi:hypothetical protein
MNERSEKTLWKPETTAIELTPIRRAVLSMGLPLEFEPTTAISRVFDEANITHNEVLNFLRNSPREEARKIVQMNDRLTKSEQRAVTLDHLCAGAKIEAPTALEVIVGEIHRHGANVATLIAAVAHPTIMKSTIESAKLIGPDGHNDRKIILQAGGTAPTPKSQITNIRTGDVNVRNTQVNVAPRLEDIVKSVDLSLIEGEK